jgi:L-glutamine-phosphate cytidylyltransferase
MRAVIPAAGRGSRLLPHTESRPKCLLKVAGRTILDYQLAALRQCGVTEVVIILGHQGDKIRAHLKSGVTFLENPEFESTGPSYSLWLSRELIRDGFIYVNSDLIFEPRMLEALLKAPHANAIVVDPHVNLSGDMMKAHMEGARILRMSKTMAAHDAMAEVVGPAKFSPEGARAVVECLDALVARGERGRWAYDVFAEVARQHPLIGVRNPGCFWVEIDTPADLLEATERMPPEWPDLRRPPKALPDAPDSAARSEKTEANWY